MSMLLNICQDALFAALAAIGFSSISNTPRRTYIVCAIAAATGHATRYILTSPELLGLNIVPASAVAAFLVGLVAVYFAPKVKCPAEVCFFPALLPMIPGMYAYRAVEALLHCLSAPAEEVFDHYIYLLNSNALTCMFIIIGMVVCANLPVFIFKNVAFQATR